MKAAGSGVESGRRYPVGAEILGAGTCFRVWAPARHRLSVVIEGGGAHEMRKGEGGYFSATVSGAKAGMRYRFRLDGGERLFPDLASRFQPDGPFGPSEIVDPSSYRWRDAGWKGASLGGQVICEMHVGTFTREGTFTAAAEKLARLKDVGITLVEMMPVGDFPGRFGWGYDGVLLFAPKSTYGRPDELKRFVDEAHRLGIGVILDIVYNHVGPAGNFFADYAPDYFTDRYPNEWGQALNFDGPGSEGVREFFLANTAYWIAEYHFDGFRVDGTQVMFDASDEHIVAALTRTAREAAGGRPIVVVAENEPQHGKLLRARGEGGFGLDAVWNEDLHRSAMVAMTGRREAYYRDHAGSPQEFVSAAKHGFLFQGQRYDWQDQPRGTPSLGIGRKHFVAFVQNHDQIANSGRGERFHRLTSPGRARAVTALMLLLPSTPMLFQGQEFWSSSPFHYFLDVSGDLAEGVRKGRREMLHQFPSLASPEMQGYHTDPSDPATFEAARLDWSEFETNAAAVALHRDLLALRREDPVFRAQAPRRNSGGLDGSVLGPEAFLVRFFGLRGDDRLLLVNLGTDLSFRSLADPLLAPPEGRLWKVLWSSEHPAYGGTGTPAMDLREAWTMPGHAAVVLAARPAGAGAWKPKPGEP